MRVAVSVQCEDGGSRVDPHFGRSACFAIFDTEGAEWHVIVNRSGAGAEHGAGIMAAQLLAKQGVSAVITGHCGPKALTALTAGGISVALTQIDDARQALAAFLAGDLQQAAAPNTAGIE